MSIEDGKVTDQDIKDVICSEQYYRFEGTTVTICCLTLKSGYSVIGHSSCVIHENFDPELGKEIAYNEAFDEVWALEGYRLSLERHHAITKESGESTEIQSD